MADNIQKLYEIAGVEKVPNGYCGYDYGISCPYDHEDCYTTCPYWIKEDPEYPPFTAEKQLELIKWLVKRCIYFEILEMNDKSYGLEFKYVIKDEYNKKGRYACVINKDFTCALAESVITMWKDLTEEERKQVKEILQ